MLLGDAPVGPSIPVEDLERAERFYTDVLGLRVVSRLPFGIVLGSGGSTSLLLYQREPVAHEHTLAGWVVADLDTTIAALEARGVQFDEVDLPGFQVGGKVAQLGASRSAWFRDSEGNILTVGEMAG